MPENRDGCRQVNEGPTPSNAGVAHESGGGGRSGGGSGSGIGAMLRGMLAHPLTRGKDLDDPNTTVLRRQIIRGKPFLRRIYEEWYATLARAIPPEANVPGRVLELGSGAGFLKEVKPEVIASDIFEFPHIQVVLDGQRLPIADAALRAIVMTNVLHHLPDVARFFAEAGRCVAPGGVIALVEPWISPWSRFVYRRLHHEPCEPSAAQWSFPAIGPLSSANQALPWIVFHRDAEQFARQYPQWRMEIVRPMMPLRYLVSGGVGMRAMAPGWSTPLWRAFEGALAPLNRQVAMFAHILLRRTPVPAQASPPPPPPPPPSPSPSPLPLPLPSPEAP
jgi:SAM-dependent methyltransferase